MRNDIWAMAPTWIPNDLMQHCFLPTDWHDIISSIGNETCVALTDRSYDPTNLYATACWIIVGDTDAHRLKGAADTPRHEDDLDAYRSKVFGIYCILICMKYICEHFSLKRAVLLLYAIAWERSPER